MKRKAIPLIMLLLWVGSCSRENLYHTLTVLNGSGSGDYLVGQNIPIEANPVPGPFFEFKYWIGDTAFVEDPRNPSTEVEMPLQDISLEAIIEEFPSFDLTVISGSGSGNYYIGQQIQIAADTPPSVEKVFSNWIGDTLHVAEVRSPATTVTIPNGPVRIEAFFVNLPRYQLTVVSGTGSGEYLEGTRIRVEAEAPQEGFSFVGWEGDIEILDQPESMVSFVTIPARAVQITASYAAIPKYLLSVVNGSGSGEYPEGARVEVEALPPGEDFEFREWSGDLSYIDDAGSPATFVSMPPMDIQLEAQFDLAASFVSFSNVIKPLFKTRCVDGGCHNIFHPKLVLTEYRDIKENLEAIIRETSLQGTMQYFTAEELAVFEQWVEEGALNN